MLNLKKMERCYSKKAINVKNVDVEKILISDEFAYEKNKETDGKYFIRYKKSEQIRPVAIRLPQMSRYLKDKLKETKYMAFKE